MGVILHQGYSQYNLKLEDDSNDFMLKPRCCNWWFLSYCLMLKMGRGQLTFILWVWLNGQIFVSIAQAKQRKAERERRKQKGELEVPRGSMLGETHSSGSFSWLKRVDGLTG